jgi:hypothetical protein
MSTAAGIGALAEGLTRGLQLSSDLQDREQRRGLAGLQMRREQAALQKDEAIASVRQQIADKVMNFNPADPNNQEQFDQYYNELTPLMMKEATLAGANPELVRQSMSNLRGARYAENLYQGVTKIQAGDASGFDAIKPLYNKMFKDGGTLVGGAYDRESDKILLNYRDANGNDQSMSVPRQAFVKQALGYANTADAMKLEYASLQEDARAQRSQNFQLDVLGRNQSFQSGESDKDRAFRAGESGLDRDLRRGLQGEQLAAQRDMNTADNQTRLRASEISAGATRYAADAGERRADTRSDAQTFKDARNEFIKALPTTFGYDPKDQFQRQDPKVLERYNRQATQATNIWDATAKKGGAYLTGQQIDEVMRGIGAGKHKVLETKGGYSLVQVGPIKAVVPVSD